ncbi:MAG TPA: DUF4214 domain-containing protein [Ramlibacter sp.]|nr:DUF4214 domain-containing protein [Ramlibacter sp.]
MSFSLTFSGPASGSFGQLTTTGTFTASITGNSDGSLSGTWSFGGTYRDSSFYGTSGSAQLSGTLSGTGSAAGPWTVNLSGANISSNGLTLSYSNGQYTLAGTAGYPIDYTVNLGYDGNYSYHDVFNFTAQLATSGAPPNPTITDGPDAVLGTSIGDTIAALGGNDTVAAADGNDTITGGTGDDSIDGGGGVDTAMFSDIRANYSITQTPGTAHTWTVTHNVGFSDGTDTLVNVERLTFADSKIAIDLDGHGGEAYRLYQAAFDRVPDIGGLGFQMNALDTGLTLEQVASNFIASPEFQAKYGGAVDDTAFVTLLYQNVLHRAPDSGGLEFHLEELQTQSRGDVLIHFSQSPENQANVMGAIQNGMLFVF